MDVSRVRQFDEKQWKSIDQFEESQIIQIFPRFLRLPPLTRCTVNLFPALPSDYFYLHAFSRAWLWRRAPRYSYSVAFQWLWRSSHLQVSIVFCAYCHLPVQVSTFANKQLSNEKDKGNSKNILLSVVFQHGGTFHDVLLVNWSNVNSWVLLNQGERHWDHFNSARFQLLDKIKKS